MPIVCRVEDFLFPDRSTNLRAPIFDVRSPGEYAQGHIPGAANLPLFTDAQRAQVGTRYKQHGREAAVELGLAIVGPKLATFVQQVKELMRDRPLSRSVWVHCWRGGMRSGSMAWLLETAGFQVTVLDGGYKAFRRWVRESLAIVRPICILGGMTGTGKTAVLHALADRKAPVLDLEALANHRGSSYGHIGFPTQPSTEHFENLIAMAWSQLTGEGPVWIEAESRMVGTCRIPNELFDQMRSAPVVQLQRSRDDRVAGLVALYGREDPQALIAATLRLQKRLGYERVHEAARAIASGNLAYAADLVLDYYDKTYEYDLQRRRVSIQSIPVTGQSAEWIADQLIVQVSSV